MPVYSNSRISTYENCPHQFRLKYIEKPDIVKSEGIEAFLGKRVHETLEKLHKELILSKLNSVEDLTAFYKAQWSKNWLETIRISKAGFTEQNYYDTGERAIKEYYKRYFPFSGGRTLAAELRLPFNLKGGHSFVGYVDRVDLTADNTYEIHDYKTSGSLPHEERLAADRQLALYQIGLRQNYRDAEKFSLFWHYLVFDKEFRIEKTAEELEEVEAKTVELIRSIETETEFKPRESSLCNWCDYPALCPVMKHTIKTEALTVEEFLYDDGVVLANRYVEVIDMIKELENEKDNLKSRVLAYAKRENISRVRGSDRLLNIVERETMKFPKTGDPRRNDLEAYIKEAGKWDEASALNTRSLSKLLNAWGNDLRKQIEQFGTPDKEVRISIKELKDEE